jgi:hypothetical protein
MLLKHMQLRRTCMIVNEVYPNIRPLTQSMKSKNHLSLCTTPFTKLNGVASQSISMVLLMERKAALEMSTLKHTF